MLGGMSLLNGEESVVIIFGGTIQGTVEVSVDEKMIWIRDDLCERIIVVDIVIIIAQINTLA